MKIALKHIFFCIQCTFLIFLLIKTNSIFAQKNCTNPSFFIVGNSVHKPVVLILSTKKISKVIALSCQNADNVSRRYKTLKDFQKHTRFFPLSNLFFGFDDSELEEEEEEDSVQKKSKTAKRNRSAYLVGFLNTPESSQFDEEKILQKTTFNHFLNPFYLDVIIQLHSPPPELFYLSA